MNLSHCVQAIKRPFNYAIVDEADSVLIDDCLNPLLMSEPTDDDPKELEQRFKLAQQVESCTAIVPHALLYSDMKHSQCMLRVPLSAPAMSHKARESMTLAGHKFMCRGQSIPVVGAEG